jgi:hypothetical protein
VGRGWSETAWNATPGNPSPTAAGSGCATLEAKPSWQHDVGCAGRTVADVSAAAADIAIYDTTGHGGWFAVEGTSAASPLIASLWAITGSSAGVSNLYATPQGLDDVTTGNNGPSCSVSYLCNGAVGYDGPTGLGTPCGLVAWGGASPAGCGVTASSAGGVAQRALSDGSDATEPAITPACGPPKPGHATCFAWRPV